MELTTVVYVFASLQLTIAALSGLATYLQYQELKRFHNSLESEIECDCVECDCNDCHEDEEED